MIPVELRTRQCLIDDIKSLEIQLSYLQERFDLIVNWIRSQYTDFLGLPEHIIIAILGTHGPLAATQAENNITKREKLLPEETEPLHVEENASCHLDENEAELNDGQHFMLKLDEAILKDIESGPVSRLRTQLKKHKLACRKVSQNEESIWKLRGFSPEPTTAKAEQGDVRPYPKAFDEDSDSDSECDPLNYVHSTYATEEAHGGAVNMGNTVNMGNINENIGHIASEPVIFHRTIKIERPDETIDNDLSSHDLLEMEKMEEEKQQQHSLTQGPVTNNQQNCENSLVSNLSLDLSFDALNNGIGKGQLIFKKQTPRVKKTPKHIEFSREKHLILDAFEYEVMISSLPTNRLVCAVCQKDFTTSQKVRRHEFEVHLTKDEQRKFKDRCKARAIGVTIGGGNLDEVKKLTVRPFKDLDALHKIHSLPSEVIASTVVEASSSPEKGPENNSLLTDQKHRTAERNFLCNKCGQSFKRLNALKRHDLAIHAKIKNFKCQYCEKSFVFQWLKTKHEKKHLGASKVTCDLCGFSFTCTSILKKHISGVHENNRPYQCHLCDKRFKTSSARNYHVNTHGNPNGRKRGLNRDIDPMKAAAKRRHCSTWKTRRVEELTTLITSSQSAVNECSNNTATGSESTS